MKKIFNSKTALLNLLIEGFGEGFSEIVLGMKNGTLRQRRMRMNRGELKAYTELAQLYGKGLRRFIDGKIEDENATYCHKDGSDKYCELYILAEAFLIVSSEDFFYEKQEDALAYLIAKCLLPLCRIESKAETEDGQASRAEYYTGMAAVLVNFHSTAKGNGTFYKWCIKAFEEDVKDKALAEAILRQVFSENDGAIATTFEKLKNERGKHYWATFDELFKNELREDASSEAPNKALRALLENKDRLKAYQIFQSRMMMAFFLENLRAALPDYVGPENAEKIWNLLFSQVGAQDRKLSAEGVFLSADRNEKNEAYTRAVEELFFSDSRQEFIKRLESLDKTAPATKLFANLAVLKRQDFFTPPYKPDEKDLSLYLQECKEKAFYYGHFAKLCGFELEDVLW